MQKKITELQSLKIENVQLKLSQLYKQIRELETQQQAIFDELEIPMNTVTNIDFNNSIVCYNDNEKQPMTLMDKQSND